MKKGGSVLSTKGRELAALHLSGSCSTKPSISLLGGKSGLVTSQPIFTAPSALRKKSVGP